MRLNIAVFLACALICTLVSTHTSNSQDADSQSMLPYQANGKWGFQNSVGTILVQARYDTVFAGRNGIAGVANFTDSCAHSSYSKRPCLLYGLVDISDREIFPPISDSRIRFDGQYAFVQTGSGFGLIDRNGELLIDTAYNVIKPMALPGIFEIQGARSRIGCYNVKARKVIVPVNYSEVRPLGTGLVLTTQSLGKNVKNYNLYKLDGQLLNERPQHSIDSLGFDRFVTTRWGDWVSVDLQGNTYALSRWDDPDWISFGDVHYPQKPKFKNGFAPFRSKSGNGFMNVKGQVVQEPEKPESLGEVIFNEMFPDQEYITWPDAQTEARLAEKVDEIDGFSEGWSGFWRDDKYGLINLDGKELFFGKFDDFTPVSDGCAIATTIQSHDRGYKQWTPGYTHFVHQYVDTNGRVLTDADYDNCEQFNNGRALVRKDTKYGYIDRNGKEVIPRTYSEAKSFRNGRARVYNKKWGVIDTSGKQVVPFKYTFIGEFQSGYAPAMEDRLWTYINYEGERLLQTQFREANAFKYGLGVVRFVADSVGCIDTLGNILFSEAGSSLKVLHHNLLELQGRHFVRKDGTRLFPDHSGNIKWLFDDYFAIETASEKWNIVNSAGETQSPMQYEAIGTHANNLTSVKRTRWTVLDSNFDEINPARFERVTILGKGFMAGQLPPERSLISADGRKIVNTSDYALETYKIRRPLIQVTKGSKLGFMDTAGHFTIPIEYQTKNLQHHNPGGLRPNGFTSKGFGYFVKDDIGHIIDTNGKLILSENLSYSVCLSTVGDISVRYKDAPPDKAGFHIYNPLTQTIGSARLNYMSSYSEGLAAAKSADNGLTGFVNADGDFKIEPQFNKANRFAQGHAAVLMGKKWGFIDSSGTVVVPAMYDRVVPPSRSAGSKYRRVVYKGKGVECNFKGEIQPDEKRD